MLRFLPICCIALLGAVRPKGAARLRRAGRCCANTATLLIAASSPMTVVLVFRSRLGSERRHLSQ